MIRSSDEGDDVRSTVVCTKFCFQDKSQSQTYCLYEIALICTLLKYCYYSFIQNISPFLIG